MHHIVRQIAACEEIISARLNEKRIILSEAFDLDNVLHFKPGVDKYFSIQRSHSDCNLLLQFIFPSMNFRRYVVPIRAKTIEK